MSDRRLLLVYAHSDGKTIGSAAVMARYVRPRQVSRRCGVADLNAGSSGAVALAEVDATTVAQVRQSWPFLADGR